jgi:2-haloacid dehalogenase
MPAPLQGIKACVFDAYGTLFDVHTPVLQALVALGDDKVQSFSAGWRDKQLKYTWLRSLMGVHADFWQVTADALDHTMQLFGLDDRDLHRRLMELYLSLPSFQDAASSLAELQRRGLRLAILSNGSPAMLDAAVRAAGFASFFVSANSWDAKAAASFGFQVVWINRSGRPADCIPGVPAVELETLADVASHIAR